LFINPKKNSELQNSLFFIVYICSLASAVFWHILWLFGQHAEFEKPDVNFP